MSRTRLRIQTPSAAWLVLLAVSAGGCSSEPGPPHEVIEIESIEILDEVTQQPPVAATQVDRATAEARTARQAADEVKAAADQKIEEAGQTVSPPLTSPTPTKTPATPTIKPPSSPEDATTDANS